MTSRSAILVINATRDEAVKAATTLTSLLNDAEFICSTASDVAISGLNTVSYEDLPDAEIVIVLGGWNDIARC